MKQLPSPFFVGRTDELSQLTEAFDESIAGAMRIVLVSGDAGAGKTRLIHEFCDRVKCNATIVLGRCTDQVESGLPYAPVTAAIRGLVRQRGIGKVVELVGASSAGDLAWLLPEFGAPRSLPDVTIVRSRLFEVVRLLVERLADQGPLIWILEDMHWADAGTRDVLRFLAANLVNVPTLLLVSYRTHTVGREDPLRALLAELSRAPSVISVNLPRLSKAEVAAQLEGILGREPNASVVNAIYARSEGIPLFTEALIDADGKPRANVPESVNDLLLCAVRELPQQTQILLRAASLGGNRIRPALLAVVVDQPESAVEERLRPAVVGNVLQSQEDGYAFRHELIREAVEGGMFVSERKKLHKAYALALELDPGLGVGAWITLALARHWHLAGEHERSLIAAWRGAGEAGSAWSYAEQLEMLELILELWPHLPDAGKVIGTTHLDVLEQAADAACWAAQPGRGMKLVEVALSKARELDDLDRVARLLLQRAPMRHQQVIPGQMDDLEAALRLSTRSPVLRIECLGQLCRAFLMQDRIEDAELQARELAELASVTGDEAARLDARLLRAMLDSRRGADTSTELETVSVLCGQRRCGWLEALAMNSLIESHVAVGRFELAIKVAAQAARRCIEVGQVGYLGASIAQNHARALQFVGRWDEAIVILEQALGVDPAPFGRAQLVLCRAEIAALCGDIETAKRDLFYLLTLPVELLARPLSILRLELEILLGEGDLPGAVLKASNVAGAKLGAAPQDAWPLLAQVVRIHIDTGKDAAALTPLLSAARHLPRTGPVEKAYADLVAAERSRTHEHAPLAPWHRAAETWAALGQPYQHAYALIRAAAIEPARGGASERLSEALALASRLGAEPLLKRIAVVAQRRRVHLQGADMMVQTGAPFSLTKREIEVLKLLAEGQTNRQIALSLVISVKTASVHVTNILSKLDVRTRGAAAAVAHRLGLTETI